MISKLKKMIINKHLIKIGPIYKVKGRKYCVKLIEVLSTCKGLVFTAEIANGEYKGGWTSVDKKDLQLKTNLNVENMEVK